MTEMTIDLKALDAEQNAWIVQAAADRHSGDVGACVIALLAEAIAREADRPKPRRYASQLRPTRSGTQAARRTTYWTKRSLRRPAGLVWRSVRASWPLGMRYSTSKPPATLWGPQTPTRRIRTTYTAPGSTPARTRKSRA